MCSWNMFFRIEIYLFHSIGALFCAVDFFLESLEVALQSVKACSRHLTARWEIGVLISTHGRQFTFYQLIQTSLLSSDHLQQFRVLFLQCVQHMLANRLVSGCWTVLDLQNTRCDRVKGTCTNGKLMFFHFGFQ